MDDFLKRVIAQREREQFAKDEGIPLKLKYEDDATCRPPLAAKGPKQKTK